MKMGEGGLIPLASLRYDGKGVRGIGKRRYCDWN